MMADITVAFDPGSLMSKAMSTVKPFKPELLLMEPEIAKVSQRSLIDYEENKLGNASPENSAWVEYKGEYQAIGFLAKDRYHADLNLVQPKFRIAMFKTLAILGSMAQKKSLPNGASVRLGFLLPYGEYEDRKLFEQIITSALASFRFRGEERSFELESYICRPEGFGLLSRGRAPGSNLKEVVIVVIMIGYRDASIYVVNRGMITKGATVELGFNKLIEIVGVYAPNQKASRLAAAICKAGTKVSAKALAHLARFSESDLKDAEISRIRAAIGTAREQYWLSLSNWISNFIPVDVDEVIIGGGTAYYYEREFNALFSGQTINWGQELESQVERCYHAKVAQHGLSYRLTDLYGYFYYLCGASESIEQAASHVRSN
jgi:hypothetical protein